MRGLATAAALLLFSSCAHQPPPKLPHPFIWALSKNGQTSYVLGTFHLGISIEELPDWVMEKIQQSSALVTESRDPKVKTQEDKKAMLAAFMMLPEGEDLKSLISPDAWKTLVSRLSPLTEDKLQRFTPLAAMALVMSKENSARLQHNMEQFKGILKNGMLDQALKKYAASLHKPILHLDRDQELKPIMAKLISPKQLEAFLLAPPGESDPFANLLAMIQSYRDGAEDTILKQTALLEPELSGLAIDERNHRWVSRLEKIEEEHGQVFIAVGAAHLLGPHSLLELLKGEGFTVTRLGLY